ncbi:MAG: putative manganese-dependent inorganic diphosphatase [Bacteroidota bacterium]
MKEKTLIFGHKNPDTDSICSAIAYSNLNNILGKNTKAVRLGSLNKETQFALNYFGADEPDLLTTVKPTLGDIKSGNKAVIKESDTLVTAMEILTKQKHSSLPVINSENKLESLLHVSQIANAYLEMSTKDLFDRHYTTYENIISSLDAKIINGKMPKGRVRGYLRGLLEAHTEGSSGVVITSEVTRIDKSIDDLNASLCVVCSKEKINHKFEDIKTPIIQTGLGIFKAFKLMSHSVSVHSILSNTPFYHFRTTDYIADVQSMMKESDQTNFPVVNEHGEVFSTIRNKHLMNVARINVILVDHNEKEQSVDGIETARILEVVDHHKFGNLDTAEPLMIRAESVGCTSTIVYRLYQEANKVPDKQNAGLMLSAILSDTLLFKSPTTTKRDVQVAKELAEIAEIDYQKYGMDLLVAGATLTDKSPEEIITMDMKEFTMGNYKTALSQVNTVDVNGLLVEKDSLETIMNSMILDNGYDVMILVITDILNKGSEVIVLGNSSDLVENAFKLKLTDNRAWLKGVVSRKKQIVPVLMQVSQE